MIVLGNLEKIKAEKQLLELSEKVNLYIISLDEEIIDIIREIIEKMQEKKLYAMSKKRFKKWNKEVGALLKTLKEKMQEKIQTVES